MPQGINIQFAVAKVIQPATQQVGEPTWTYTLAVRAVDGPEEFEIEYTPLPEQREDPHVDHRSHPPQLPVMGYLDSSQVWFFDIREKMLPCPPSP